MKPSLSSLKRLTALRASAGPPVASPDGQRVAFALEDEVYLLDEAGRWIGPLGGAGARGGPVFCGDRLLAYAAVRDGRTAVEVMDLESGKRRTQLEHPRASLFGAAFSQVRGRVCVSGDPLGRGEVLLEAPLGGGSVEKLTEATGQIEKNPAYSPDGLLVAFEVYAGPQAEDAAIAIFDTRRRRTKVLAFERGTRYVRPCFLSPTRLVFSRIRPDGTEQLIVAEAGSKRLAPVEAPGPASAARVVQVRGKSVDVVLLSQDAASSDRADPRRPHDVYRATLEGALG